MFTFEPPGRYMMPAHFGERPRRSARYGDVTTLAVTYLTDRARLARYLPTPFEVGAEPLLSVFYAMNRDVDWLAGAGYNLLGVNASATFRGAVDHVTGAFCLVLWENLTEPILTGRELQGIPKIFADIEDHTVVDGVWRTTASLRGHAIVDLAIRDLARLSDDQTAALTAAGARGHWMGWKYVPSPDGIGAEVSHATLFPTTPSLREAWAGRGEVRWHRLTWEQNPTQFHIANALAELPILEYRSAIVTRGGTDLAVPGAPVRALR